jgi:hypothetical protein
VYYKYYLGAREPRRPSDFADLGHLYAIPYCHAAIIERDLANTLAQIKRHDRVLDQTEIYDLDIVSKWANPAANQRLQPTAAAAIMGPPQLNRGR